MLVDNQTRLAAVPVSCSSYTRTKPSAALVWPSLVVGSAAATEGLCSGTGMVAAEAVAQGLVVGPWLAAQLVEQAVPVAVAVEQAAAELEAVPAADSIVVAEEEEEEEEQPVVAEPEMMDLVGNIFAEEEQSAAAEAKASSSAGFAAAGP